MHDQGPWRGLVRANYFGEWYDTSNGNPDQSAEINVDAEVGYTFDQGFELIAGASNIFDNYPDENPGSGGTGQLYPEGSPSGFNGGAYYLKARYTFD